MKSGRVKRSVVALSLCLAVAAVGCRTVDRVERAEPIGSPNVVDDTRVLTRSGLHRVVKVVSVRETTVGEDLLKVEADVENVTASRQRFVYAFEWFDGEGMRIREPQWRTEVVEGRQRSVISGVATSPDAVDFRLHLMRSR